MTRVIPALRKNQALWATLTWISVAILPTTAKGDSPEGLYQIVSGLYLECCSLTGEIRRQLPNERQSFIRLTFDPKQEQATMAFLGADRQTVFGVFTCEYPE